MTTFSDLYNSLDADSGKRGKQFELFVRWFLKNEPEWSTQVDQVWLWDEWPKRWGADCGIDLVFRHKNGEIWAVQAKCYSPEHTITKHDVDKFISESSRPGIDKRLLIATTDKIGANAKQVCDAQDKAVVRYLLDNFEGAAVDYPAKIEDLRSAKRKDPPEPRPHQLIAIDAVTHNFKGSDRGQLIMACGTGKTYTTLWIKESLKSRHTLVLLPSLSLLSQTLKEWTFAAKDSFDVLCVCSDQTVGTSKRNEDEIMHSVSDLAFPVTSNTESIKQFLQGDGHKVVFSTYQSSPLIAEAQKDQTTPAFDLVIADEAHRCTGKTSGDFATILDGKSIRASKRLFATATPRTYTTIVKKAAEDRGIEVVGMDDEAVFGKVLYSLPFGEAIRQELLTDYRVVIVGVDDPMIAAWIENREIVIAGGMEKDAESLAAQIGLLKAIKDYDLRRVISFHSRVSRAEAFSQEIHEVAKWVAPEHRPSGDLWSDFVSGEMVTSKRRQKLDHLKALGDNERGLLTNARCLSEGVDVPSLDGVTFIDPKSSQIDIIQAVGRAIRLSGNKKYGTIVLPVFIAQGEDAISSIEASNFKPIWDVLNALKAHDEELVQQLDAIRTELGRKPGSKVQAESLTKIVMDLPVTIDQSFSAALRTYLVEQATDSWNYWYGLLETYVAEHGDAKVPNHYKTHEMVALGAWVNTQRVSQKKCQLSQERITRLEALTGWVWDPLNQQWEEGCSALEAYVAEHGDTRVAATYKTQDGIALGAWVSNQRTNKNQGKLSQERITRLEALPGWVWVVEAWEEGFGALKTYVVDHGNAMVPNKFKKQEGVPLGAWVSTQRQLQKEGQLSKDRIVRLEALPGWVWDRIDQQWDAKFEALKDYITEHGNARVHPHHKTQREIALRDWVYTQRTSQQNGQLSQDRVARLEVLPGWVWDPIDQQWEAGFEALKDYIAEYGDVRVHRTHKTHEGIALGKWVSVQRTNKNKDLLSQERITRLEALPGWVWDPLNQQWEEGCSALEAYVAEHGDTRVAATYKTQDGIALGAWVSNQRTNKNQGKLSQERITRLEALPGWVWVVEAWEEGFGALKTYVVDHGNARVSNKHKTNEGVALGSWVANQRTAYKNGKLSQERITRLEVLPGWVWSTKE